MSAKIDRTGEIITTTKGYKIEIIEYVTNKNCTIKFMGCGGIIKNIVYSGLKTITHPGVPSTHSIGYIGFGKFKSCQNGKENKNYTLWNGMLGRCYSVNSSYKNVTVAEEWHNFQNFADWFEENYKSDIMQGWHLDKDILEKGNRVYSSETCCFVPNEINSVVVTQKNCRGEFPIGVTKHEFGFCSKMSKKGISKNLGVFKTPEEAFQAYKIEKEKYIKKVAEKWKDKINQNVYQALINYKVEITD